MYNFIFDQRINEIIHLKEKIIREKTPTQNLLWEKLILLLGQQNFFNSRFTSKHIAILIEKLNVKPGIMKEIIQMAGILNKNHFPFYRDISMLYKKNYMETNLLYPSLETKYALRDLFLYELNEALQDLYRIYLKTFPPSHQLEHSEKISLIFKLEDIVYKLLDVSKLIELVKWFSFENPEDQVRFCLERLSNYVFPVNQVNFRFSNHCNIACRHCYNSSGPKRKKPRLNLDNMVKVIGEMSGSHINHLNITGGEPFLYMEDLIILIKSARKQKIRKISIYTNGFWADSPYKCKKILKKLKKAGFLRQPHLNNDYIKVSSGIYHQEFIPFKSVMSLAENYFDFFHEKLRISYELLDTSLENKNQILSEIKHRGLTDKVILYFREIEPSGRGVHLLEKSRFKIPNESCTIINQIVFNPDGKVKPCCGFNTENSGIHIGDIKKHSVQTLVKNMQNDPILQFITKNPIENIFQYLDKKRNINGYPGLCFLCQHAIGSIRNREPLKQKLFNSQEFYPFWFSLKKLHHFVFKNGSPVNKLI